MNVPGGWGRGTPIGMMQVAKEQSVRQAFATGRPKIVINCI